MATWPWVSASTRLLALADPINLYPLQRLLLVRKLQGKVGVYVGCSGLRPEPRAKGHCKCALGHLHPLLHAPSAKSDLHEAQICPPLLGLDVGSLSPGEPAYRATDIRGGGQCWSLKQGEEQVGRQQGMRAGGAQWPGQPAAWW